MFYFLKIVVSIKDFIALYVCPYIHYALFCMFEIFQKEKYWRINEKRKR